MDASTDGNTVRRDCQCLQTVTLEGRELAHDVEKVLTNEWLASRQPDFPDSQTPDEKGGESEYLLRRQEIG